MLSHACLFANQIKATMSAKDLDAAVEAALKEG
jgi:hypothetical protein